MNLFEIDKKYTALFVNTVNPETGEIIGEHLDVDALQELAAERREKVENIGLFIKNEEAKAKAIGDELKSLQARKKSHENRVEALKRYLLKFGGGENVETARVCVKYSAGRESTVVDAPEDIPEAYRVYTFKPDKTAIKKAIKAGEKIPGAHLERKPSVSIK